MVGLCISNRISKRREKDPQATTKENEQKAHLCAVRLLRGLRKRSIHSFILGASGRCSMKYLDSFVSAISLSMWLDDIQSNYGVRNRRTLTAY